MPDFSNFGPGHITSAVIAVLIWAWFFVFVISRARKAGVEYEEPPIWLYGPRFRMIRWLSLALAIYLGLIFPLESDVIELFTRRSPSLALAAVDIGVIAILGMGIVGLIRRKNEGAGEVLLDSSERRSVALKAMGGMALLVVLLAVPFVVSLLGGEGDLAEAYGLLVTNGSESSDGASLGAVAAILPILLVFWVVTPLVESRLEEQEVPLIWARPPGFQLFRWGWLGLMIIASFGIIAALPGFEETFAFPLNPGIGIGLAILGIIIYYVFWAVPMKSLRARAEEGDHVANELLPYVRFAGFAALMQYKTRTRSKGKKIAPGETSQICPTCFRPINDINSYKGFKFDSCPHCGEFIPPLFTMLDYVKGQSAKLLPIVEQQTDGKKKRGRTEDEGRLVQDLLRALVAMGISERGTDLHFVVEDGKFIVRCRTDGFLFNMMEFNQVMARPLISSIKVQANLDIAERRKPQDGRFSQDIGDRSVDIRVNTSPVGDTEMATLRLFYRQTGIGSLERLGMSSRDLSTLRKVIHNNSGLILVTGPTGSGKSTTLYNALEVIATGQRNIVTLEDPIEYIIKGLTQMQINIAKGFTFATGLRSILRQDPDVIMIGEIRDAETAKMAIDAAATGHLVFTTLHATDSVSAIGRLSDLGIDTKRVAAATLLVLAQRLIRLVCPKCASDQIVTREEFESMGLPGFPETRTILKRGLGCPHCHETGYYGREGVYEFFAPNDELRDMMIGSAPGPAIRQRARSLGMRTLKEDAITKAMIGRTTLDEALKVN